MPYTPAVPGKTHSHTHTRTVLSTAPSAWRSKPGGVRLKRRDSAAMLSDLKRVITSLQGHLAEDYETKTQMLEDDEEGVGEGLCTSLLCSPLPPPSLHRQLLLSTPHCGPCALSTVHSAHIQTHTGAHTGKRTCEVCLLPLPVWLAQSPSPTRSFPFAPRSEHNQLMQYQVRIARNFNERAALVGNINAEKDKLHVTQAVIKRKLIEQRRARVRCVCARFC